MLRALQAGSFSCVRCCTASCSPASTRPLRSISGRQWRFSAQQTPMTAAEELVQYQQVAVDSAKSAGAVIEAAFHKEKAVEYKGSADLVTQTDKECEQIILSAIQNAFPSHRFIGEEGSSAQGFTSELTDEPTWMVDPLVRARCYCRLVLSHSWQRCSPLQDGTTNFVHRWPFVCVSIGLAIKRQIVVGVVFNPILCELYTACRGQGAFLNHQPIKVSATSQLNQALLGTEVGVAKDDDTLNAMFGRVRALAQATRSVRCSGACALNLCSVAAGRLDVMYEVGFGGPWDCAAGALIVEEAGGQVLDPDGGRFDVMARRVLAANGKLGKPAAAVLAGCPRSSREPAPPSS